MKVHELIRELQLLGVDHIDSEVTIMRDGFPCVISHTGHRSNQVLAHSGRYYHRAYDLKSAEPVGETVVVIL